MTIRFDSRLHRELVSKLYEMIETNEENKVAVHEWVKSSVQWLAAAEADRVIYQNENQLMKTIPKEFLKKAPNT